MTLRYSRRCRVQAETCHGFVSSSFGGGLPQVPDIFGLPGQECDRRLQTTAAGGAARCSEANRKVSAENRRAQESSPQTGTIKRW